LVRSAERLEVWPEDARADAVALGGGGRACEHVAPRRRELVELLGRRALRHQVEAPRSSASSATKVRSASRVPAGTAAPSASGLTTKSDESRTDVRTETRIDAR